MKKLLIATGLATLLASSAFACKHGNMPMEGEMGCKAHKMDEMKKDETSKLVYQLLGAFAKTAPSEEQITKAKEAVENFEDAMEKVEASKKFPIQTLQDDKFDKNVFASICLETAAQKLQAKADLVDKIYSMLDTTQKREFKREFASKQVMKELKN